MFAAVILVKREKLPGIKRVAMSLSQFPNHRDQKLTNEPTVIYQRSFYPNR